MAAVDTTRSASYGLTVGSMLAGLKAWNDARLTRLALSRLSDRELADIGLTRDAVAEMRA